MQFTLPLANLEPDQNFDYALVKVLATILDFLPNMEEQDVFLHFVPD